MLVTYYATTIAYSIRLKAILMLDVLVLAGLYTLRIIAGAVEYADEEDPGGVWHQKDQSGKKQRPRRPEHGLCIGEREIPPQRFDEIVIAQIEDDAGHDPFKAQDDTHQRQRQATPSMEAADDKQGCHFGSQSNCRGERLTVVDRIERKDVDTGENVRRGK